MAVIKGSAEKVNRIALVSLQKAKKILDKWTGLSAPLALGLWPKFHYTTPPPFLSIVFLHKFFTKKIPKFVQHYVLHFSTLSLIIISVKGTGEQKPQEKTLKKFKKTLDRPNQMCYNKCIDKENKSCLELGGVTVGCTRKGIRPNQAKQKKF